MNKKQKIIDLSTIDYLINNKIRKIYNLTLVAVILNILFSIIFVFIYFSSINRSLKVLTYLNKKYASKVLVVTPDGRILEISKQDLNLDLIIPYIKLILKNYFIYDKRILTSNFEESFSSFEDFIKFLKNEGIYENLKVFFASKNELKKYIKMLYIALPKMVDEIIVDKINLNIEKDKKGYLLVTGVVKAIANVYNVEKDAYDSYKTEAKIKLKAIINPLYGSEKNPFGFKIIKIERMPIFIK